MFFIFIVISLVIFHLLSLHTLCSNVALVLVHGITEYGKITYRVVGKFGGFGQKYSVLALFPRCFVVWDVPGSPSRTILGNTYFPLIRGIISLRTSSSTVFLSPPSHFRKASDLASHVHSLALFLSLKEPYTNTWVFSLIYTSKEPLL